MSSLKKSVKINSPLPKDLAGECKKASKILNAFIVAAKGIDNIIPPNILSRAKGLAIFTVIKAGFLFSGRAGSGVVVARLEDGTWSAPSAIGTGGMGFGGQIGAEITDFVIILNTRSAVRSFMKEGNVTLGGNLSVAAGPIGRTAEAGASATVGAIAAIYSYSKTKGLFAGVSIEGSIIIERKDTNEAFYRAPVTAQDLLSGAIPPPPQADILYRALNMKADYHADARTSLIPDLDEPAPSYSPTASISKFSNKPLEGKSNTNAGYGRPSSDNNNPFSSIQNPMNTSIANKKTSSFSSTHSRSAPPPPAPSAPPVMAAKPVFVTALYDYAGEQPTDLSFSKGDRISVVKKTESTNDWWTGRLNGREGAFPANYVQ
ncbi:actin cortical patch component Lsb4 [Linnemannia elongata]|nr:actin cortical patch component Lsb4 [Linnemannia elongata]